MKINQKISLCFAAIITPITLFSVLTISSIKKELKEVGDFHISNLYLMQNLATKATEAVEESFAYIASGHISEKEAFLVWAEQTNVTEEKFKQLDNAVHNKDKEEIKNLQLIIQEQNNLIKKANQIFNEFESKKTIHNQHFVEYEFIVDSLLAHYAKAIKIEEEEVDFEQKKAIKLIEDTVKNISILGLCTVGVSILSGYFIAQSISKPINKLKLATLEVAKGNLDTSIHLKSQDEIGELATSFAQMTEDLKKYREELISEKNYTTNIFKSMSDALIVVSCKGSIITVNKAACSMLGYQEQELIDQPFEKVITKEELLFDGVNQNKLISNIYESSNTFETYYLAKDGSKIPISFSSSLMLNENGEFQAIVCLAQDITERKKIDMELNNALQKERELGELKSRFITMASHEFRTPLATILSSTELLEHYSHKWTEEKKLNHFQRIQAAVKQMTGLLNDVLLIGKAEAGKLDYKSTTLNLVELCQSLTEEVQAVARTKHTIDFSCVGTSNNAVMDEKLLRHILVNLLTNAVKYSPQGGRIKFNLICDRQVAVFSIQDSGIGIPLADQEKLFESFHRGTNVSTIPGTGLGLAIVKKSVDLHDGKITVDSQVKVGTTFTVTLPLHKQV